MEINELVLYDRLREIESRLSNLYFRVVMPRQKDYDKEKWLEEYKKFGEAVHEEMVKLDSILTLIQPDALASSLSLFVNLFKDEMMDMINRRRGGSAPCAPIYAAMGHPVDDPDKKTEPPVF